MYHRIVPIFLDFCIDIDIDNTICILQMPLQWLLTLILKKTINVIIDNTIYIDCAMDFNKASNIDIDIDTNI